MKSSESAIYSNSVLFDFSRSILLTNVPSHAIEKEIFNKLRKVLRKDLKCNIYLSRLAKKLTNEGFGYIELRFEKDLNTLLALKAFKLKKNEVEIQKPKPIELVRAEIESKLKKEVHITGLPAEMNEDDLMMFFSKFGEIENIIMGLNKKTKKCLGFASISFVNQATAQFLIKKSTIAFRGNFLNLARKLSRTEIDDLRPIDTSKYSKAVLKKLKAIEAIEKQDGRNHRNGTYSKIYKDLEFYNLPEIYIEKKKNSKKALKNSESFNNNNKRIISDPLKIPEERLRRVDEQICKPEISEEKVIENLGNNYQQKFRSRYRFNVMSDDDNFILVSKNNYYLSLFAEFEKNL